MKRKPNILAALLALALALAEAALTACGASGGGTKGDGASCTGRSVRGFLFYGSSR